MEWARRLPELKETKNNDRDGKERFYPQWEKIRNFDQDVQWTAAKISKICIDTVQKKFLAIKNSTEWDSRKLWDWLKKRYTPQNFTSNRRAFDKLNRNWQSGSKNVRKYLSCIKDASVKIGDWNISVSEAVVIHASIILTHIYNRTELFGAITHKKKRNSQNLVNSQRLWTTQKWYSWMKTREQQILPVVPSQTQNQPIKKIKKVLRKTHSLTYKRKSREVKSVKLAEGNTEETVGIWSLSALSVTLSVRLHPNVPKNHTLHQLLSSQSLLSHKRKIWPSSSRRSLVIINQRPKSAEYQHRIQSHLSLIPPPLPPLLSTQGQQINFFANETCFQVTKSISVSLKQGQVRESLLTDMRMSYRECVTWMVTSIPWLSPMLARLLSLATIYLDNFSGQNGYWSISKERKSPIGNLFWGRNIWLHWYCW